MKVVLLGNGDAEPDVCATADGWLVAWVPIVGVQRQPLRLDWVDRAGVPTACETDVFTGTHDGGVNPRLAPADARIWLAHRAVLDGIMKAVFRVIEGRTIVSTDDVGRADGPLALNGDWLAWQDVQAQRVFGRRLTLPVSPAIPLRFETRPTGLSRMDGDWPLFVDEDRLSIPGMLNPVRVPGLVVGEGPTGGIVVRTGGAPSLLLAGAICGTPRGAVNAHGEYAAVCWGGVGVRLVLFTRADLVQ